jgi:membrane protease YdiL (CAAX protease family)
MAQGAADGAGNVDASIDNAAKATAQAADRFAVLLKDDPWQWGHLIAAGLAIITLLFADVIRPGSLERAGKRGLEPHSSLHWFMSGLLVMGMMMVGAGFATLLKPEWLGAEGSLQRMGVLQALNYGTAIVTAILLCNILSGSAKGAGLKFTIRSFPLGLLAFLAAWPIVIASSLGFAWLHESLSQTTITQNIQHPTLQLIVNNRNSEWAWIIAFLAIVAAPIVEEIVYRGFLQSSLLKLTAKPWTSVVLASAIFAGIHMLPIVDGKASMTWYAAATIGVLGLCMGVAYERTKEIGVPITMHVLFNLTNVAIAVIGTKGQ